MIRRPAPLHPRVRISIVQRPQRKAHAATFAPGADRWTGLCGREILADGAAFVPEADVVDAADERADELCLDCRWLLAFASYVATNVLASPETIRRIS